jgi:threonine dehydrogenase-like Zn-dependent dehydrogenase
MGKTDRTLAFARTLNFAGVWKEAELPPVPWDAVIDASNAPSLPGLALDLVEPGKRIVYVGLAGTPSPIDTRTMALKDVTAVGILAASQGLAGTIEHYAAGDLDPRPLVAATIGLDHVGSVLAGWRPDDAGSCPKTHSRSTQVAKVGTARVTRSALPYRNAAARRRRQRVRRSRTSGSR